MKSMNNRKISDAVSSEQEWGRAQHDCQLPTANCRLALVVVTALALAGAAGIGRARWIENGVGGAWGITPAETAVAFVPWDDAERTRATMETLALAGMVVNSNVVVVAGAGIEAVNGSYTLDYEDEWSAFYVDGEWAYGVSVDKDEFAWGASIVDFDLWEDLYATDNWPEGWTVVGGVAPAPVVGYEQIAVTNLVDRSAAARWELAHDWGDHAAVGYLTEETNPGALALDQGEPQSMNGFPLWENPLQRIGGRFVTTTSVWTQGVADWDLLTVAEGTVAFWGRTTQTLTSGLERNWVTLGGDPNNRMLNIVQEVGSNKMRVKYYPGEESGEIEMDFGIDDGQWRHYAVSWGDNEIGLYVDGELVDSAAYAGDSMGRGLSTPLFRVSNRSSTQNPRGFQGSIDAVGVWTNTLSAVEIADLWRYRMDAHEDIVFPSTGRGTLDGLKRLYRLDEESGTSCEDALGGPALVFDSAVTREANGPARSFAGAGYNEYLRVEGDLERPADLSLGELRVGNPEATTRLLGALAVGSLHAAPASAGAAGLPGELRIAADGLYVCVATNTWVKAVLATW